ncbi:MAG: S41 family peptidase [Saprospiraceae bacterium]
MFPFSQRYFTFLMLVCLLSSCQNTYSDQLVADDPVASFDYLWQDFADHYGTFQVKNVDWENLYSIYRPQINDNSSPTELFDQTVNLLEELNDSHIYLFDPANADLQRNTGVYGERIRADFYDLDLMLIQEKYLSEIIDYQEDAQVLYGKIANNIGYLYLGLMFDNLEYWEQQIEIVLEELANTDGLIIDIRDNGGGEDEVSRLIASYFATERQLYMLSRYKIGKTATDFAETVSWHVEPNGRRSYTQPLVLLTDRYTISAAETFTLAMRTMPQLTHVGDTTTGAFSDTVNREMPNGWRYGLPVADVRDANGESWESLGLPPEVVVIGSPELLNNGQDVMLEKAIDLF